MFQQKYLILVFLALFVAGSAFLFWQNERELDPDRGKSWWTLSFANPQTQDDLLFTVENHSDQVSFRYEITVGKEMLAQDVFSVQRGETLTITPPLAADPDVRTTIIVTAGTEKKEIYR
ncbi:MAG: hypothetical protein WAW00_03415 [Candidatus Moraniibacteriota bacterium]